MATDHLRYPTGTGEAAPTTHPRHTSETRNEDHNTPEADGTIATLSRRRFFMVIGGGLAVAAVGGGVGVRYVFREAFEPQDSFTPPVAPPNVAERREPLPAEDLTLNTIRMPETLNPATFIGVVENVGNAIQFAVNHNDQDALGKYIPGGSTGVLMPGQFQLRAAFIDGLRHATPGEVDDINAPRYYPWGFSMDMMEQVTGHGYDPRDPNLQKFIAKVKLRMGDLPPSVASPALPPRLEEPHEYITNVTFTRRQGELDANGNYVLLPNLEGQPGYGWGISNVTQMYPVPPIMTGVNLPKSFDTVPPVFNPNPPK